MNPFLKKIMVFGVLWFTLFYAACWMLPIHYFNREYPMWKSKMEVTQHPENYNNFILGDSRAIAGFDTKSLGANYYNLALGGGTPIEGYYQLKRLLENGAKVDTLLVSYSPIHLEQSEMFWDRQVKYGFYNPEEIKKLVLTDNKELETFWAYDAKSKSKSSLESEVIGGIMSYYKSPYHLRTEIGKSMFLRGYSNQRVYRDIRHNRGTYDFGTAEKSEDLNVEALRTQFKPRKIIIDHLEKLFDLATLHKIKVFYVSLPMNQASAGALHQDYTQGVRFLEHRLKEDYHTIDFVYPAIHSYDNHYFGDASHLNQRGRKKFTLDFIATLNKSTAQKVQFSDLRPE